MEPKILYRSAVEQVPTTDYTLPLGQAEILTHGSDITIVGWGSQIYVLEEAIEMARKRVPGLSVELIDLRTVYPFDVETIVKVSEAFVACSQSLVARSQSLLHCIAW